MTRGLFAWLVAGAVAVQAAGAEAATAAPGFASPQDRDALTRVAVAEAGNQGDSGMAAVVQTILNRLASGAWGATVEAVVDAPHQFEPVARVGGDWRRLPAPSASQRARVDTILALMADGRLPDFIGGALYFQNSRIVASRVAAGAAPADRLNFGGQAPVAVVGAHAFYAGRRSFSEAARSLEAGSIFYAGPPQPAAPTTPAAPSSAERNLFILADGRLALDPASPAPDR